MDPAEFSVIGALYAEVFGAEAFALWSRRWRWQFFDNPATRFAPSRLWVAELDGQPAGFLASFTARLWLRDHEETIFYPCDLLVTRRAAGYALGVHLIDTHRASPGNLLPNALQYSFGNGLIHDRLRYRRLEIQQVCLRPYRAGKVLRAWTGPNPGGGAGRRWLSRLTPVAAPVAELVTGAARSLRRPPRSRMVAVDRVERVGPEFDALWQAARGDFEIVPVRHREWAEWRYDRDPLTRHELLFARDPDGHPLGYVAVSGASRRGLAIGRVMDLFASPRRPDVVQTLLAHALDVLEGREVDLVSCMGLHPAIRRVVSRYLFLMPQRLSVPARVLWQGDPALASLVYDASAWHLSYADGDEAFA